jgi:hypothetical protein
LHLFLSPLLKVIGWTALDYGSALPRSGRERKTKKGQGDPLPHGRKPAWPFLNFPYPISTGLFYSKNNRRQLARFTFTASHPMFLPSAIMAERVPAFFLAAELHPFRRPWLPKSKSTYENSYHQSSSARFLPSHRPAAQEIQSP